MATNARTLYGTTNKSGSVPNASAPDPTSGAPHAAADTPKATAADAPAAGPVYSDDGKLILNESFAALSPIADAGWFDAGLHKLLTGDDYVETWRLWDCYAQNWADADLVLHRFEMYDLVIRRTAEAACSWQGSLDTYSRIEVSRDPEENERSCWQWLRDKRVELSPETDQLPKTDE